MRPRLALILALMLIAVTLAAAVTTALILTG